jgi:hypothetical protein
MTRPSAPPRALPAWAPGAALGAALLFAWLNFVTTGRWAHLPGALQGWRLPLYAAALSVATVAALAGWRRIGRPASVGPAWAWGLLASGVALLLVAWGCRMSPAVWNQIPFKDNWTELFQQASNGVALLKRGVVVGWNWGLVGGQPTSVDIAQNLGIPGFLPMALFGDRIGYHLLHAAMFVAIPIFLWWDLQDEPRETRIVATGLSAFFAAAYSGPLGSSGDTNSLVGVCCVLLALLGSHAARRGRWWGGAVLLAGLTVALHTHAAFAVYAGIFLLIEAAYFRDPRAVLRLAIASAVAAIASLPTHWESLRYPEFVSFNNTVYDPDAPKNWAGVLRGIYYNTEILLLPHRWFNDYRSINNVWLPVLVAAALLPGRSRAGYYAWLAVASQALLRINTPEAGAMFERIQHVFPLLTGAALAGFVLRCSGGRVLAIALTAAQAIYVSTAFEPIRHVRELRDWDPPFIDRVLAADGALVLVEASPHRDMDKHPTRRTPTTPFDVHFEGLLPHLNGRRFYAQMIDGWTWSRWRGEVVAAGTFRGSPIAETPPAEFDAEMARWGVKQLFVWTDATRAYLAASGRYVERWRGGRWSQFERLQADGRSVVTTSGSGELRNLDWLGGDVVLRDVGAGEPVVVRSRYYPAWRAFAAGREVPLHDIRGQLAFTTPAAGSYTVRLEYPRYRALSILALVSFLAGALVLARWPRGQTASTSPSSPAPTADTQAP